MKLCINSIPLLGAPTGVGNYAWQMARAVADDQEHFDPTYFYGYCSRNLPSTATEGMNTPLGKIKQRLARQKGLRRMAKKVLTLADSFRNSLYSKIYDCYFEPNFILLPGIRSRRAVLTAHDFSCFLYPQWHPQERVRHMEKHFRASLERADNVITVSEAMRQEAIELFGLQPERVLTIHNGVDHGRFYPHTTADAVRLLTKRALPEHFILFVGTVEPRKNLENLLLAHNLLPTRLKRRFPLVLVGAEGWNNTTILQQIEAMTPHVRLLGYVPLEELPALYTAATLFAYPSWYEGFGLPVVEAMACGCPVLTSDHAALVEVCGDAAVHTPPGDPEAMSHCLCELLENADLRTALRTRGLERAALFSWKTSARQHRELFVKLCEK